VLLEATVIEYGHQEMIAIGAIAYSSKGIYSSLAVQRDKLQYGKEDCLSQASAEGELEGPDGLDL
jgi:hypothetical protein